MLKTKNLTSVEVIKYFLEHNEDFKEEQELALNLTLKTVHLLSYDQICEIMHDIHVDYLAIPANLGGALWNIVSEKDRAEYFNKRDATSPHPALENWEIRDLNESFKRS